MGKAMRETLRTVLDDCLTIGGRPRQAHLATASALSKARSRLGAPVMSSLYAAVVKQCATRATPGPVSTHAAWSSSMAACIDMAENYAAFGGAGKDKGHGGSFPVAQWVVLVEASTHIIFAAALFPLYRRGNYTRAGVAHAPRSRDAHGERQRDTYTIPV